MKPIKFQSELLELEDITSTVRHFRFSCPKDFSFIPGQFLTAILSNNEPTIRRSYSLASSPDKDYIELCIKKVDKGLGTKYLFKLQVGDKVDFIGPLGMFVVKNKDKKIVLISTGTGIGPFRSIIHYNPNVKIMLLTGYRSEDEVLYDDEFNKLKNENFEYHYCISQPINHDGNKGRVQELITKYVPEDFDGDFYLCGLKDMIFETKDFLRKKGIDEKRIYFERYD